jgi:hypothetical protein
VQELLSESIRRCDSVLAISPRSPLCKCAHRQDRPRGNFVGGFLDDQFHTVVWPAILNSQEDPKARLELMLRLRSVNKSWKGLVNTSEDWYEHVFFKEGFEMQMLSSESEENTLSGGTLGRTPCPLHRLITLDDLLTDPQYM